MIMKRIFRILFTLLAIVLALLIGVFLYFSAQGFYQTRNMRYLAKQVDKTEWQDYSYNIYSESVTSGFYEGEIWGPNNTYLQLGVMHLDDRLEEYAFFQINDVRICSNGFVKFISFVESQTGGVNLTFTEALLQMESAYETYKTQLETGSSPKFPREYYNKETQEYYTTDSGDCKPELGMKIPEKIEKSIRYP